MSPSSDKTSSRARDAPLRVAVVGRISTPHQDEENIQASYRYVEDHLHKSQPGPLQITHLGERASGMLAERQSIRQLEDMISAGQVDLVVAEDLSRIFRNPRHQFNFVQDAVDAGVRVLCLADNLDTASENWELMLGAAGLRHGLLVSDTRRRVRRTATHSFHNGGMVMRVRFGYRKLTPQEALSGEFGPKGLRLAKNPDCTPTIHEMRKMILAGKSFSQVALWLNEQSIRPGTYVKTTGWTAKILADYLRAPILHGERTFRNIIYQPILRTGKHRRERNPTPERQYYPELAHFTPEEHAELVQAIQSRTIGRRSRRGNDHPRYRVPRCKAIWPAQHLTCHSCGGLMYLSDKGKLKCSNTFYRGNNTCWNHVQVRVDLVRRGALGCLLARLEGLPKAREAFLAKCWTLMQKVNRSGVGQLVAVEREIQDLLRQAERLTQAVAAGGELPVLIQRLKDVQEMIDTARAHQFALEQQAKQESGSLDYDAFCREPLPYLLAFGAKSYELTDVIAQVIADVEVIPVQDLVRGQVRPRIRMRLQLRSLHADAVASSSDEQTFVFDAFQSPKHIQNIARVREVRRENSNCTAGQIAESLGISKDALKRTLSYVRLMDQRGLSEPYLELMSQPARASRWRRRSTSESSLP